MELSIMLAKVVGLYLVVVALALLINRKQFPKIIKDYKNNLGLNFTTALITFILGLLYVLNHNFWTKDWTVLITIIGWLILIKGVFRMLFPKKMMIWTENLGTGWISFSIFIMLIIGIYLTYHGFTAIG